MNKSEILEDIRDRIDKANLFEGNSFRRGRCSADFTGISDSERVVVDLDSVFPSGQEGKNQCECVLFYFFGGEPFEIKTARCGDKLANVLSRIR